MLAEISRIASLFFKIFEKADTLHREQNICLGRELLPDTPGTLLGGAGTYVVLLQDNNINSFEDIANLDPNEVVIPDSVADVIDSLDDVSLDDLGIG